jgi:hypothetical protein
MRERFERLDRDAASLISLINCEEACPAIEVCSPDSTAPAAVQRQAAFQALAELLLEASGTVAARPAITALAATALLRKGPNI